MKRDMDLIRHLLLAVESNDDLDSEGHILSDDPADFELENVTPSQLRYHQVLLLEGGLLRGSVGMTTVISGMTMRGHDFLDSIRDPLLWEQTKKAASEAGGFTLELLGDLAKGFIKTQIERHTSVSLG